MFPLTSAAVPADVPALAALASATFRETFGHLYSHDDLEAHLAAKCSEAFFSAALEEPDTHILIAWEGSEPVGYIKWGALELPADAPPPGSREIHRLYVVASHQRSGLGRRLMEQAMLACADAPAIYLGVWEHNHKAQRFYAGYGFTHAGEHAYPVGTQIDRDLIWVRHA